MRKASRQSGQSCIAILLFLVFLLFQSLSSFSLPSIIFPTPDSASRAHLPLSVQAGGGTVGDHVKHLQQPRPSPAQLTMPSSVKIGGGNVGDHIKHPHYAAGDLNFPHYAGDDYKQLIDTRLNVSGTRHMVSVTLVTPDCLALSVVHRTLGEITPPHCQQLPNRNYLHHLFSSPRCLCWGIVLPPWRTVTLTARGRLRLLLRLRGLLRSAWVSWMVYRGLTAAGVFLGNHRHSPSPLDLPVARIWSFLQGAVSRPSSGVGFDRARLVPRHGTQRARSKIATQAALLMGPAYGGNNAGDGPGTRRLKKARPQSFGIDEAPTRSEDGRFSSPGHGIGTSPAGTGLSGLPTVVEDTTARAPKEGDVVLVRWSSYKDLTSNYLPQDETSVVRVQYLDSFRGAWRVHTPLLDQLGLPSKHWVDKDWVRQFGSTRDLPPGATVVMASMLVPQRSYIDALRPSSSSTASPDTSSKEIDPTRRQESPIYLPEVTVDGSHIPPTNLTISALGVAGWNVNAYHDGHLHVAHKFWEQGVGVTFLLDTRLPIKAQPFVLRLWQRVAGIESKVLFGNQTDNPVVGAQLALVDPSWSRAIRSVWKDPSPLGLLLEIVFNTNEGPIRVLSAYWPTANNTGLSLGGQLATWLQTSKRPERTTDEYMINMIRSRATKPARQFLLVGDLNHTEAEVQEMELGLKDAHAAHPRWTFSRGEVKTRIDFILHSRNCSDSGVIENKETLSLSDHLPVWAHVPIQRSPPKLRKSATRRVKMDLNEDHLRKSFQLATLPSLFESSLTAEETLAAITQRAAKAGTRRVGRIRVHLWTPFTAALLVRLTFLKDACAGTCSYSPTDWTRLMARFKKRVTSIGKDGAACLVQLDEEPGLRSLTQLGTAYSTGDVAALRAEIKSTSALLQGKRRAARRNEILRRVKEIRQGEFRFFSHLGKPRVPIDLSTLLVEGHLETDPARIDAHLAAHYQQEFAAPSIPQNLWGSLSWENLRTQFPQIPVEIISHIWTAMRSPADYQRHAVGTALSYDAVTPSEDEFLRTLDAASKKSAGGPSGCTYEMLKSLPHGTKRLLYRSCCDCWRERSLPQAWKTKLLFPLAKKQGEHSIGNIRPIVLLEVVRKLWYKVIIRRVMSVLEAAGSLQPNQYGFRPGRSTADPILQFVNAMEAAPDQLAGSSWDIKGAFNAPPRPWLEFAMRRLGVAEDLAHHLAFLDDNDTISILTPFRGASGTGVPFSTGRGCGQGDVVSPGLWAIFFDMTLTAVNSIKSDVYFANGLQERCCVSDTAFADDLLSLGATLPVIQAKADIVAGCAIIFNFTLATQKFRTFSTAGSGYVEVRDCHWTPTRVACSTAGFLTYLGSTHELNGGSKEESRRLLAFAQDTLDRIRTKAHTDHQGGQYLNRAVIPAVRYRGQFGSLPNHALNNLDCKIGMAFKAYGHVPASFPTAVVAAPTDLGGLGFLQPSVDVARSKWRSLQRLLASSTGASRDAAEGIVQRALRQETPRLPMEYYTLTKADGWLGGILTALAPLSAFLRFDHGLETNKWDVLLPHISPAMRERNVITVGDVVERCVGGFRLGSPENYGLPLHAWAQLSVPGQSLLFQAGQTWAAAASFQEFFQLQGWQGTAAWVLFFTASTRWSPSRKTPRFLPAGSRLLPPESLTHRLTIRSTQQGYLVVHASPLPARRRAHRIPPPPLFDTANHVVASDATYVGGHRVISELGEPHSAIGIVALNKDDRGTIHRAHYAVTPVTRQRAFAAELLAMTLATRLHAGSVLTDCKGALQTLQRPPITSMERLGHPNSARIRWQRSHPERYALSNLWTDEERAIAAADNVAGGHGDATLLSLQDITEICLVHSRSLSWCTPAGLLLEEPFEALLHHNLTAYLDSRIKDGRALWHQGSLQFLQRLGKTLPQKGTLAKLFLGRFEADRQSLDGVRPRCPCNTNCGNVLGAWLSTCTLPAVVAENRIFSQAWAELDLAEPIRSCLLGILQGEDNLLPFRGNWLPSQSEIIDLALRDANGNSRTWRTAVTKVTALLTRHSLSLYHIVNSLESTGDGVLAGPCSQTTFDFTHLFTPILGPLPRQTTTKRKAEKSRAPSTPAPSIPDYFPKTGKLSSIRRNLEHRLGHPVDVTPTDRTHTAFESHLRYGLNLYEHSLLVNRTASLSRRAGQGHRALTSSPLVAPMAAVGHSSHHSAASGTLDSWIKRDPP